MVIQDTGISSKSFSGIDWNAGARVKISGTIGGVTTGTVEGILAANMNNTANKLELKSLSGGNWSSVAANTYTAGTSGCHDLTVMLYNTGTYPVGILLNCYGTNNKATIDIYGGTSATPHVAIGLLNGRFSQLDGVDVSGWGIYTDNGYFTGTIHAGSGRIGGFEIASSAIKTAGVAVTSNADNSVSLSSADFTRTVAGASRTGLRFAIGDKFGVTGDGVVCASSATISGSITATSGYFGGSNGTDGWKIETGKIQSTYTLDNATKYMGIGTYRHSWAFFSGASTNGGSDGVFKVGHGGELYATNAHITGEITATSGKIGGWTIESNAIEKHMDLLRIRLQAMDSPTDGNHAIRVDTRTSTSADWTNKIALGYGGYFYAGNATIVGTITANTGYIGGTSGWTIAS